MVRRRPRNGSGRGRRQSAEIDPKNSFRGGELQVSRLWRLSSVARTKLQYLYPGNLGRRTRTERRIAANCYWEGLSLPRGLVWSYPFGHRRVRVARRLPRPDRRMDRGCRAKLLRWGPRVRYQTASIEASRDRPRRSALRSILTVCSGPVSR